MKHYRWVRYHGTEWNTLVSDGWITVEVEEGMALMLKETKL